ncbi:MAG: glycosyltransferase family 4 protein [Cyanobacteria bacterium]|nr:glycosyltransferase family 4 protein [Cyanobacteriota bacterium]MDW8201552.1 glycosyltransferase family 4 protein [Cyanobacteriota bacterium SKYGB_h_bin112]
MHIAWLGKKSPFCGNVTYSREITNALLDRGHHVSFLHFAQDDETANGLPDYQEVPLPFLYKSQIYTIPTLGARKILTQSLSELQPDVVHASLTLSPLDFVLPEICEELNLPLVATFHPAFDRKRRNLTSGTQHLTYQLYAPFLANYDAVIVFSQIQKDILARLGVPLEKLAVIPNGVDTQKYSPGRSRLKAELGAKHVFLYMGRIAPEKNVESLLKGWKRANMGDDCALVIVGDGPLRLPLETASALDDTIVWWGYEPIEQRRIEVLRGADVFILPSLIEGLSLSLLEAMACGLACVATDAGADGEAIAGGAGVILQTEGVATQLKVLLPQLRDHSGWVSLMGQAARQRVLERYTLSQNITHLEALYQRVLQPQSLASKV